MGPPRLPEGALGPERQCPRLDPYPAMGADQVPCSGTLTVRVGIEATRRFSLQGTRTSERKEI